jgi:hypothetical protein
MGDDDLNDLMAKLGMEQRRKVVRSLMIGNDAQCFTTRQYAEAYHRIVHHDDPDHKDGWIEYLVSLTPQHMKSVGMVEVKPGVWAPKLLTEKS